MTATPSGPPLPLWQSFAADASFSDPGDCEQKATRFEKRIERRNWLEHAAGLSVIAFFGIGSVIAFVLGEWLIGATFVMIVLGTLITMRNLQRRATNLARRPEDPCRVHLRRQYQRQYDALRSVPRWYVGPIVPGMVLFYLAVTDRVADEIGWERALEGAIGPAAVTVGILAFVLLANWYAARWLKREIDALDALA